jgi:predicted fused transcriptional regulator/phosphomethylpyrimidine kinase
MELHVSSARECENVVSGVSVRIHVRLANAGFYSYSVFKSSSIIARSLVNIKHSSSKIRGPSNGS